jgi:3'-phosphoadenosine 5'-phosphosulfate sulfotransferase (PAPS reductase)/FAD synthetase
MKKLVVSFSGGETSGRMAALLSGGHLKELENTEITYIFANTGLENEETLRFVDFCDNVFELNVVWVEAAINPKHGKGVTHRVTNFKDAYRPYQYRELKHPFHAHIRKSGIPNPNKPQCSDRLKAFAIEDYKKKNGLKGVPHAIGIRADEPNRIMSKKLRLILSENNIDADFWRLLPCHSERMKYINNRIIHNDSIPYLERYSNKLERFGLVYPLSDWFDDGFTKEDVNIFWEECGDRLELEEHEGNCQTCWKKSDPKLFLLAKEHPERFEPFEWFEYYYKQVKPNNNGVDRVFFRKNRSVSDIINQASEHSTFRLRKLIGLNRIDENSGCSESCESYDINN